MINNFGAFLGMGMLAITVAFFWHLATRDEKKAERERKKKKKSIILMPGDF